MKKGIRVELGKEPPVKPGRPNPENSFETAFARRAGCPQAEIVAELERLKQRSREPPAAESFKAFTLAIRYAVVERD